MNFKKIILISLFSLVVASNVNAQLRPAYMGLKGLTNTLGDFYIRSYGGSGTNTFFGGTLDIPAGDNGVLLRGFTVVPGTGAGVVLYSKNNSGDDPILGETSYSTSNGSDLTIPGILTAAASGNDVLTHTRFQFVNRATTTVTGIDTDTTLTNATASGSVTIPANYLTEGTTIEVEAGGVTEGISANPVTNKFKLSGSTIATGFFIPEGDTTWYWKATITIRTAGAGGTYITTGFISHANTSGTEYPNGSGSINTTTAKTIDFTTAITGASGDVICQTFVVKVTRP